MAAVIRILSTFSHWIIIMKAVRMMILENTLMSVLYIAGKA